MIRMKEYKLSRYNIYHEEPYFVANTFTGSEMQMEREEYFAVKNLQLDYFDEKTVTMLEEAGIIVESSCNELQLVLDAYAACKRDRGNKNKHMLVTIAPSLFCNFDCPQPFALAAKPQSQLRCLHGSFCGRQMRERLKENCLLNI